MPKRYIVRYFWFGPGGAEYREDEFDTWLLARVREEEMRRHRWANDPRLIDTQPNRPPDGLEES